MNVFANLPDDERRDVLNEVAVKLGGVDFTIAEKDFWVCWTLNVLFGLGRDHPSFVFKGGTSLSKAYDLIARFSEDIDVVTPVDFFIVRGAADPDEPVSGSERQRRIDQLDTDCRAYVQAVLQPALADIFAERLGSRRGWGLLADPDDRYGHTLLFEYPPSDRSSRHEYLRGHVKIELGWRSATEPAETRIVAPYVAAFYPTLFGNLETSCRVLTPNRTFWEKATALHAESFRDEVPHFFSRHYSDVAALARTDSGRFAIVDLALLEAVRTYKMRYYASARARYDLAVPGSLRLIPSDTKLRALTSDYRAMRTMFFAEPPPFSKVIEELDRVQTAVNAARATE